MSLRKPGRKTAVGLRPSSRAQANSTPSPRSSCPVIVMSDPKEKPVQRARDVIAAVGNGTDALTQVPRWQNPQESHHHDVLLSIMRYQWQCARPGGCHDDRCG